MSRKRSTNKTGRSVASQGKRRRIGLAKYDLVLLPCTKGKEGYRTKWPEKRLRDFISPDAAKVLRTGQRQAFKCNRTQLLPKSTRMALLDMYTGFVYTPAFKRLVRRLLERGIFVLVVTGGYGLAHPQERKRKYEANLSATSKVWRPRLPVILEDFITRNKIRRVFIACSESYARVLASGSHRWAKKVQVLWYTPRSRPDHGNRAEDIAKQIRRAVRVLSKTGEPDARWMRGFRPDFAKRRRLASS